ncbi:ATP-binding protein [Actinomadura rupiterrae]|uniref:ATP-binding protein n=1 Tax=Actinomadura rupiterrae TaxID=559627 RepID=UPI0020A4840F|nr:ATP-binding protein [Actinomadura rupiterrae]MCP2339427.1 anti-sigma regulatory factor (Ser/Thr protein kinase) [Actinomadura rupiterrae]
MTGDLVLSMLGSPAAAGLARTMAAERLRKWGHFHLNDDVALIVAELVANAAEATPRAEIRFQLSRDGYGIVIAVWDSSAALPVAKPVVEMSLDDLDISEESFDANGGWGLPIVAALSSACGCTADPAGGKWIWARLTP